MCIHTLPVDIHCVNARHGSISFLLRWKTPHTAPVWGASHGTHELLHCGSMPGAAVLPKLWLLPEAAVLQEQAAPLRVSSGSDILPANLLQYDLLSPWVHISATRSLSHGVTSSFGHLPALLWDPHGCRGISAPPRRSMGTSCFSMTFPMGCRRISCPSFPTDLGSAGLFF